MATQNERTSYRIAVLGHVAPFALWLTAMAILQVVELFGVSPRPMLAPLYALKSLFCAVLLLWFRPWRFYAPPQKCAANFMLAVAVGAVMAFLWIFPETPWFCDSMPGISNFYLRWGIMPFGQFPSYFSPDIFPALPHGHLSLAYSPLECGWFLTICKLLGSAFVIAVAEEYFFRGFLYRWLRNPRFLSISPQKFDFQAFVIVLIIFGIEHDRWFMGIVAGILYGWLFVKTGRVGPAAVAHVTTNLLLGIYVIFSKQYGFW